MPRANREAEPPDAGGRLPEPLQEWDGRGTPPCPPPEAPHGPRGRGAAEQPGTSPGRRESSEATLVQAGASLTALGSKGAAPEGAARWLAGPGAAGTALRAAW